MARTGRNACCVPNCQGDQPPLHRFPISKPWLFKEWKRRIQCPRFEKLEDKEIRRLLMVCNKHFLPWNDSGCGKRLMNCSIPTVDVPGFNGPLTKENSFLYPTKEDEKMIRQRQIAAYFTKRGVVRRTVAVQHEDLEKTQAKTTDQQKDKAKVTTESKKRKKKVSSEPWGLCTVYTDFNTLSEDTENNEEPNTTITNYEIAERVAKINLENIVVKNTASLEELKHITTGNTDKLELKKVLVKDIGPSQNLKNLLEFEPAKPEHLRGNINAIIEAQKEIGVLDVIVCGQCHMAYHFLEEFKEHKEAAPCTRKSPIGNPIATDHVWGYLLWKNSLLKLGIGTHPVWELFVLWRDMPEAKQTPWVVAGRKIMECTKISKLKGIEESLPLKIETVVDDKAFKKLSNYVAKTLKQKSTATYRIAHIGAQSSIPTQGRRAKRSTGKPGKEEVRVVEKILAKRLNSNSKQYEYLVKWEGLSHAHDTLEPHRNLAGCPRLIDIFEKQLANEKKLRALKAKHITNQYITRMHEANQARLRMKRGGSDNVDETRVKKKIKKELLPPSLDPQSVESLELNSNKEPMNVDSKKGVSTIHSVDQLASGLNTNENVSGKQQTVAAKSAQQKKGKKSGLQLQGRATARLPLNQINRDPLDVGQTAPEGQQGSVKGKAICSKKKITERDDQNARVYITSNNTTTISKLKTLYESLNISEDLEMTDDIASDDDYVTDPFPKDLPPIPPPSPERELTLCPFTGNNIDREKPPLRPRCFKNITGTLGSRVPPPSMPLLHDAAQTEEAPVNLPTNESIMVQGSDGEIYQVAGKNDEGKTARELIGVDGVEGGEVLPVGTEQLAQLIPIPPPSEQGVTQDSIELASSATNVGEKTLTKTSEVIQESISNQGVQSGAQYTVIREIVGKKETAFNTLKEVGQNVSAERKKESTVTKVPQQVMQSTSTTSAIEKNVSKFVVSSESRAIPETAQNMIKLSEDVLLNVVQQMMRTLSTKSAKNIFIKVSKQEVNSTPIESVNRGIVASPQEIILKAPECVKQMVTKASHKDIPLKTLILSKGVQNILARNPQQGIKLIPPNCIKKIVMNTPQQGIKHIPYDCGKNIATNVFQPAVPTGSVSDKNTVKIICHQVIPPKCVNKKITIPQQIIPAETESVGEKESATSPQKEPSQRSEGGSATMAQIVSTNPPSPDGTRSIVLPNGSSTSEINHEQWSTICLSLVNNKGIVSFAPVCPQPIKIQKSV